MLKPNIEIKTKNEREKLETIVRKNKSAQRDVIRAKVILAAATGLGNRTIAQKLGTALNKSYNGVNDLPKNELKDSKTKNEVGDRPLFPPKGCIKL